MSDSSSESDEERLRPTRDFMASYLSGRRPPRSSAPPPPSMPPPPPPPPPPQQSRLLTQNWREAAASLPLLDHRSRLPTRPVSPPPPPSAWEVPAEAPPASGDESGSFTDRSGSGSDSDFSGGGDDSEEEPDEDDARAVARDERRRLRNAFVPPPPSVLSRSGSDSISDEEAERAEDTCSEDDYAEQSHRDDAPSTHRDSFHEPLTTALRPTLLIVDPGDSWRRLAAAAAKRGLLACAVVTLIGGGHSEAARLARVARPALLHVIAEEPPAPLHKTTQGSSASAAATPASAAASATGGGTAFGLSLLVSLACEMARLRPVAVLPGSPSAVAASDPLAACLGLPHNSLATLCARCDKVSLALFLETPGAAAARSIHDALEVGRRCGFPLVVRDCSIRTPGAVLCKSEAAAGEATGAGLGGAQKQNERGLTGRLLVQPFYPGETWVVCLLCSGGETHVTSLWHFLPHPAAARAAQRAAERAFPTATAMAVKERIKGVEPRRGGGGYDQCLLVDATKSDHEPLLHFARECASALGARCGALQVKLRWGGPGTRSPPVLLSWTEGVSVFDELAASASVFDSNESNAWCPFQAAVASAEGLGEVAALPPHPRPLRHARILYLPPPPQSGKLVRWHGESQLALLSSYHSHSLAVEHPGMEVPQPPPPPTRAALAQVHLLGEDEATVEQDAAAAFSMLWAEVKASASSGRGAQCAQQ